MENLFNDDRYDDANHRYDDKYHDDDDYDINHNDMMMVILIIMT